jgi:signal transduction histidine kinase
VILGIRVKLLLSYFLVIALCMLVLGTVLVETIGGAFVTDMEKGMIDKARLLTPAFPALSPDSDIAQQQLSSLHSYIRKLSTEIGHRIRMLDAQGVVLADSALPTPSAGESVADRPEVKKALAGSYSGYMRHTPEAPDNFLSMYVALPVIREGKTVGVIYLSSTLRHVRQMLDEIGNRFRIAALIAILLSIIMSVLLARAFSKPIQVLRQAANELASGNWAARAQVTSRDELGQLAKSFNDMADKLVELEKVRRDYMSEISHELRTPLTAIKGFAETLQEAGADDSAVRQRYLDRIIAKTDHLSRLVQELLDLARLEAGQTQLSLQPIELEPIILEAVETLRIQAEERGVRIGIMTAENLPTILGDGRRLQQVLENLISNALRATERGGEVRVSAGQSDGLVAIEVTDTGIGIPEEQQSHIFERFYRIDTANKSAQAGTGLGLTIAKRIVEAHGGQISVTSKPDCGATFRFTLPIAS